MAAESTPQRGRCSPTAQPQRKALHGTQTAEDSKLPPSPEEEPKPQRRAPQGPLPTARPQRSARPRVVLSRAVRAYYAISLPRPPRPRPARWGIKRYTPAASYSGFLRRQPGR